MNRRYRYYIVILLSFSICGICGCTKTDNDLGNSSSEVSYDVDSYKERLQTDRIPIKEYKEKYLQDTADVADIVADMDSKQLHFDDVTFGDFPETDRLILGTDRQEDISVEDTLAITENWLQEIGKADEVDLESELALNYLNHPYLEISEEDFVFGDDPDFMWPLFYDHISELKYGTGAFIDRLDCSMNITTYGMDNMSDGKFSAYLESKGITKRARHISQRNELGTQVATGKIEELAEETYPLLDGEMSIGDGAKEAEKYLAEDDARLHWDNIGLKLADVTVYQVEDIYCYEYTARRLCYGIPVVRSRSGNYSFYGSYSVAGDTGRVFVIDHDGVTAYVGINDGQDVIPLLTEEKLIGLADAARILNDGLATQINVSVDFIELSYLPLWFNGSGDSSGVIYFPCWHYSGTNRVKDEQIELYVDALTGDIYYYTWDTGEEYSVESTEETS